MHSTLFVVVAALQIADAVGLGPIGFANWRPTLYAFLVWGVALELPGAEVRRTGKQTLFVLPAILFTAAMVIFPTMFGLYIAFTDWNIDAESGHHFNGLDTPHALGR